VRVLADFLAAGGALDLECPDARISGSALKAETKIKQGFQLLQAANLS
jgi:hypothetical protein